MRLMKGREQVGPVWCDAYGAQATTMWCWRILALRRMMVFICSEVGVGDGGVHEEISVCSEEGCRDACAVMTGEGAAAASARSKVEYEEL